MASVIAAGRVGTVEEVAQMVAFLLSDDSSYCYGSEFVLDGGYLAGPLGSPNVNPSGGR
jgi:3alpha(or 20beta)-hydroxysteroid dehydrogenase